MLGYGPPSLVIDTFEQKQTHKQTDDAKCECDLQEMAEFTAIISRLNVTIQSIYPRLCS